MRSRKSPEICFIKQYEMETLLIINSGLLAICLYFIKDFHTEFKEVSKKVTSLEGKVQGMSRQLGRRNREDRRR